MGQHSMLDLFDGGQLEPHRAVLPRRIDAIHTESQGRAVACLRELYRLASDGLGLAFHKCFGRDGDAVPSPLRLAFGIARLPFAECHRATRCPARRTASPSCKSRTPPCALRMNSPTVTFSTSAAALMRSNAARRISSEVFVCSSSAALASAAPVP